MFRNVWLGQENTEQPIQIKAGNDTFITPSLCLSLYLSSALLHPEQDKIFELFLCTLPKQKSLQNPKAIFTNVVLLIVNY